MFISSNDKQSDDWSACTRGFRRKTCWAPTGSPFSGDDRKNQSSYQSSFSPGRQVAYTPLYPHEIPSRAPPKAQSFSRSQPHPHKKVPLQFCFLVSWRYRPHTQTYPNFLEVTFSNLANHLGHLAWTTIPRTPASSKQLPAQQDRTDAHLAAFTTKAPHIQIHWGWLHGAAGGEKNIWATKKELRRCRTIFSPLQGERN